MVAFKDAHLTSGTENAKDLGKGIGIVGQVAEAERGGNQVEAGVGVGEVHGIAFNPESVCRGVLCAGSLEHFGGEVETGNGFYGDVFTGYGNRCVRSETWATRCVRGECGKCRWPFGEESRGHVTSTAANVENAGFGTGEDVAESVGGASPPTAIKAEGEQVVEAVVAGRDGVEKGADVGGGGSFVGLVGGSGACGFRRL